MQGRTSALLAAALAVLVVGLSFLVFEQRTANQRILSELDRYRISIDLQTSTARGLTDQIASLSGRIVELERDNKDLRRQLVLLQRRRPAQVASLASPTPLLESLTHPLYTEHATAEEPATLVATLPITWATDWTAYQPAGIIAAPPPVVITRKLADPAFMRAMYASFSALQAADIATTLGAIDRGAREGNPLLRSSVESPSRFIAIKTASTVATVYGVEQLRKRNPMVAGVTLIAINATLAAVAVSNANVAR
jgi:hypothetical protein